MADRRALLVWVILAAVGFLILPWYALQDSVWALRWLNDFAGNEAAPAMLQITSHGRTWLAPVGMLLLAAAGLFAPNLNRETRAAALIAVGASGFLYVLAQGFSIGPAGWSFGTLANMFGPI
ncbi:MAG: iron ABC transporter permease, partial [Acidobacteriota bacterium]